jgi:hypothetical protein
VETSKKQSSVRQLKAAIEHFHKGDFDCAITLAATAQGILPNTTKPYLFTFLKQKAPSVDFNQVINWLKHPTNGPEEMGITKPMLLP